jgi:hypothetical protein
MNSFDGDAIARACERLVYRAALFTDRACWDELAALFAPDGKLLRPSDPTQPIKGRQAILASLRGRPARTTRHILSNILVDIHSANNAHISSTVTLYTGPAVDKGPVAGQKILVGHFEDDVVLLDRDWQFVLRDGSMAIEFEVRA